jgi:hypothetical protein
MLTKSASSSGGMLDASSSPRSSIADGEHNEGVGSRPQDAEETIAREEDQLDLVLYPDESCPSFKVSPWARHRVVRKDDTLALPSGGVSSIDRPPALAMPPRAKIDSFVQKDCGRRGVD